MLTKNNEANISLEFALKTPYFVISSPEKTLAHDYLISSAKKSDKTLLFWCKKKGFYLLVRSNDTVEYTTVDELLLASLADSGEEKLHQLYNDICDIVDSNVPRFVVQELREENEPDPEKTLEIADLINTLKTINKEDAILFWWVHIASHVLHNVCLILDGNFRLMTDLMLELEQHQTDNPVILLTTKEVNKISSDDGIFMDEWVSHTNTTPILKIVLDSQIIKEILCDTLREYNIPIPSNDILRAASGVLLGIKTKQQVRNIYSRVIVQAGKFGKAELPQLFKLRDETVGKDSELLSPIYVDKEGAQLGGLDLVKEWVQQHKSLYTSEAKAYGLHPPQGLILCGPPGTGKTACAKYIAYEFNRPLIVFNVGLAFKRYVGDSEILLKNTFDYLDSLGDVVVLLDEVDRFLGENESSHESTRRVTAAFLTWQSSRSSNVFVIAASNSLSKLPPEFTRAGRFDKVYYVDLPGLSERMEILDMHLKKRHHGTDFGETYLQLFASHTSGFSGAELENVVEMALLESYLRDKHLCVNDMLSAIKKTKPLSLSRLEEIKHQRMKANAHASPASSCSYELELASRIQTSEEEISRCYC